MKKKPKDEVTSSFIEHSLYVRCCARLYGFYCLERKPDIVCQEGEVDQIDALGFTCGPLGNLQVGLTLLGKLEGY